MRDALSAKGVIIDHTEASGHLDEIPHVPKAAECVTAVLPAAGNGAPGMVEDASATPQHWHQRPYTDTAREPAVELAAAWAAKFVGEFADSQAAHLPWRTKQ
jgi:hypothetical protein